MKKNLLQTEAAESIIARVQKLQPTDKARWGQMTATEMLRHANLCNEEVFTGSSLNPPTSPKQFFLRILALYIAPHFKKNIKGAPKNETAGKIDVSHFAEEKERFIQLLRRFPQHKGPITLHHVAFGNLSTQQWGIALYKHMDHHLRQFGA